MAKATVISIEPRDKTIHCYSSVDSKHIRHCVQTFKGQFFDGNFAKQFTRALGEFIKVCPIATNNINIVLPNSAIMIDFLDIPTLNVAATKNNINLTANALYKNFSSLKHYYFPVKQDKSNSTYCVTGVKGEILNAIKAACLSRKFQIKNITYNAQSILNAAMIFHPRMKTTACIVVDIKDNFTTFVFGINGKVVGYYSLSFGLNILNAINVVPEDMIHQHHVAEAVIGEAKMKMTRHDDDEEEEDEKSSEGNAEFFAELERVLDGGTPNPPKEAKEDKKPETNEKTPRVLPEYMRRPAPQTKAELVYENFRIFVKWSLLLNRHINKFKPYFKPRAIYVNMPSEFGYLFNMVNAEKAENEITFASVSRPQEKNTVLRDIELYGAIDAKHMDKDLNFFD